MLVLCNYTGVFTEILMIPVTPKLGSSLRDIQKFGKLFGLLKYEISERISLDFLYIFVS
jgi:hypothetical protein